VSRGNGASPHDPQADFGELWTAVHDYLVAQASESDDVVGQLSRAYERMVAAHNMIHERYVAPQEGPPRVAGV